MKKPSEQTETLDWIEKYLLGGMNEPEKDFFEKEMVSDLDFRKEVESVRQSHQLMQEAFLEKAAINTLQGLRKRKSQWKILTRTIGSLAAACLVCVCYLSFSTISFPDSENDFNVIRGTEKKTLPPEQKVAFEQFFDGQAHIAEGKYLLAVSNFEEVLKVSDLRPYFREAAQWHLIVAFLRSNQPHKAERMYESFRSCIDCEYPISTPNRWKIWWQIYLSKLFYT